ncbi:MAG: DNA polymerase III subunit beta [Armatimonadetes bacterium]|nr:DNA polymerase III subunit beta [Armatimonadota bacterium]
MKFVTQREQLQQAIGTVQRAVSSRSTLPILSNILLEADGDGLTLSATDHEIGIRARLAVDTEIVGRTTLPARLFSEVVGAQPAGPPLVVESDDSDHVTFRCGRGEMEVHGLPADEFPVIPALNSETSFAVPQGLLKHMINACIIAVGHDETRARLTGMLFTIEDGRLRLVATDTHRLATCSEAIDDIPGSVVAHIIPARALREVERLLSEDDKSVVNIDLTESQVQFRFDGVTVISRLIEGEFPNYRKVIPSRTDWTITMDTARLRESVKRCAIVSREDNRKLILRATVDGQLHLNAASTKIGRAEEMLDDIEIEVTSGVTEGLEIAFNADYLHDVLVYLKCEQIKLQLTASNHPGAVKPVAEEDYVYVLMPMQMG